MVSVNRLFTFHSSWKYADIALVDEFVSRTPKSRFTEAKAPSIKSATGSPLRVPLNEALGEPMKVCSNCSLSSSNPELEIVSPLDPVHGILELVVMAEEPGGIAGAENEFAADVEIYRALRHVLRHIDTEG